MFVIEQTSTINLGHASWVCQLFLKKGWYVDFAFTIPHYTKLKSLAPFFHAIE